MGSELRQEGGEEKEEIAKEGREDKRGILKARRAGKEASRLGQVREGGRSAGGDRVGRRQR